MFKTIYSIDARDNVYLEVIRNYLNLNGSTMRNIINELFNELIYILKSKGIEYEKLKNCLTPQLKKNESALIFDTHQTNSGMYGSEIYDVLLPLLEKKSCCSFLHGDLILENNQQESFKKILENLLKRNKNKYTYRHSTQFFCIYINNLPNNSVQLINKSLEKYPFYIGYIDVQYNSLFKSYLSTNLMNGFIKYNNFIIQPQPEDSPIEANENTLGYNFKEYGFICKSIPVNLFDVFLSYKIERPVYKGFESDSIFNLYFLSNSPQELSELEIEIEDEKYQYLISNKSESLKKIDSNFPNKEYLKSLISKNILSNYIYNIAYSENLKIGKFNIIIENAIEQNLTYRFLVSMEYQENLKKLRLITFF
ncbi:hypothetical protein ACO2KH_18485 [Leptospira terpstrae]|uniref:hypothetical protein n=1 Tax=Leptospira terpstrae TaxID=293075 RepID=UPI003D01E707